MPSAILYTLYPSTSCERPSRSSGGRRSATRSKSASTTAVLHSLNLPVGVAGIFRHNTALRPGVGSLANLGNVNCGEGTSFAVGRNARVRVDLGIQCFTLCTFVRVQMRLRSPAWFFRLASDERDVTSEFFHLAIVLNTQDLGISGRRSPLAHITALDWGVHCCQLQWWHSRSIVASPALCDMFVHSLRLSFVLLLSPGSCLVSNLPPVVLRFQSWRRASRNPCTCILGNQRRNAMQDRPFALGICYLR
mmetsp:Transcript_93169/g.150436  ORF Transcript_93169/g.150436 Transcript_93169/m.150436 type:complete len:249 (+) Transcript_93169:148-894(+)